MNWVTQGGASWSHSTVPSWTPGQTVTMVQAACCPGCGSIDVLDRGDNGEQSMRYYVCKACTHRWKMPQSRKAKATVV